MDTPAPKWRRLGGSIHHRGDSLRYRFLGVQEPFHVLPVDLQLLGAEDQLQDLKPKRRQVGGRARARVCVW